MYLKGNNQTQFILTDNTRVHAMKCLPPKLRICTKNYIEVGKPAIDDMSNSIAVCAHNFRHVY